MGSSIPRSSATHRFCCRLRARGKPGARHERAFCCGLRSPVQRHCVRQLAREIEADSLGAFGREAVVRMKELANASGFHLRLLTVSQKGAGLATSSGYNVMNWTSVFVGAPAGPDFCHRGKLERFRGVVRHQLLRARCDCIASRSGTTRPTLTASSPFILNDTL